MKKASLIFIVFGMILSCNHRRTAADFIELGKSNEQYKSVNEYFEKRNTNVGNEFWIKFMFLNNPYNLDDKNIVSIYANSKLVYSGEYKKHIELKGLSAEIFAKGKGIDLTIEVLTDKNKKNVWLHRFSNKSGADWREDYQIIYCGFFPTNENVEQMYFFPQLTPFIN